jgi:effector-binding domain-containing protein
MKKTALTLILLASLFIWSYGQEVKIQDNTPFAYAYLEGGGPYTQLGAKIGELMQEAMKQQVRFVGGPFGLYLNSPQDVKNQADLKWLVGIPIPEAAMVAAPLKKDEFHYAKVARCTHKGPYEAVAPTYAKVMEFIAANGYRPAGPVMEQYLNDPMTVPASELLTEIIVPVEKK